MSGGSFRQLTGNKNISLVVHDLNRQRNGDLNDQNLTSPSTRRHDLTESLKKLQCRTLIFVGENSQFHADAVHMTTKLDRRYCALVEVTYSSKI